MATTDTLPARPLDEDGPTLARLFVYPKDAPGHIVQLRAAALTIGRRGTNDLVLDDRRASSAHAQLRCRRDTGKWHIEDLGSTNGTFVEGLPVQTAMLASSTVFRIGDTLFIMETGPRMEGDIDEGSIEAAMLDRKVSELRLSEAPVLILGATGAGKGYLAARIVNGSPRGEPLVHVNCAALPRDLVEAELFGYEKGAFTGANAAKPGLLEAAHGGTLFLDEIGELPPELQAKLLTTIEDGNVRRVGATKPLRVDVRILAATNLNVDDAIEAGTFRKDLYFRLAARTLRLPPLCRRRPDIVPIFSRHLAVPDHRRLTPEALEALLLHPWPGNVRELLNVAATVANEPDGRIDYQKLPEPLTRFLRERAAGFAPRLRLSAPRPVESGIVGQSLDESASTAESRRMTPPRRSKIPPREELIAGLDACGGNVSELARRLGKHRNQVVRWLDAYGLRQS